MRPFVARIRSTCDSEIVIFNAASEDLFLKKIPELIAFQKLIEKARLSDLDPRISIDAEVEAHGQSFPVASLVLGSRDPRAPVLAVFAGVHGLERIGADVAIAWAESLVATSHWDRELEERLRKVRVVLMPLVNPAGVFAFQRANANGVDLMRNSPVRAFDPPYFLGGQDYSSKLPWYSKRVNSESEMELESRAVLGLIDREMAQSQFAMSVDIHSGFGAVDRLWFPWAKSKEAPPYLAQIQAFKELLDVSHPNHVYRIEPQAKSYTTHGDLWDWALEKHIGASMDDPFVPWTLELGSWLWVKKNPRQLFSSLGGFNPILPHRRKRILRRHATLLDFFLRAVANFERWGRPGSEQEKVLYSKAAAHWYQESA